MIKKVTVPLGMYPHRITKKEENTSQDTIKMATNFFKTTDDTIKTMKVSSKGHEVFKNGFTAKK
jgi:hypothetical protein